MLIAASLLGGKPLPALLLAVEKVEPSVQGEEKSEMAKGFLWISVAWFVAVTAVAAFAYGSASSGGMWGLAIFVVIGGWSLYEAASSPIVLGRMYPGSIGWKDWLAAAIGRRSGSFSSSYCSLGGLALGIHDTAVDRDRG